MPSKKEIGSFAVLDLETTGLPSHNFNRTNITEIAIHGLAYEDVFNAKSWEIPRINHKITLNFNPLMMIHPKAEEITGLNNFMLEHESTFDENAANVIISFLKHLRQPVCIVAHNGNTFDFPILKQAFEKIKMEIPSDIMCVDSLKAFRELDKLEEELDREALIALEDLENPSPVSCSEVKEEKAPVDWQKLNETTPKRPTVAQSLVEKKSSPSPRANVKRKSQRSLSFGALEPQANVRQPRKAYKLGSIYLRLFGEVPEIAHHAEEDVVMLKKIILRYGQSFTQYAVEKATPFGDIKKLGQC